MSNQLTHIVFLSWIYRYGAAWAGQWHACFTFIGRPVCILRPVLFTPSSHESIGQKDNDKSCSEKGNLIASNLQSVNGS